MQEERSPMERKVTFSWLLSFYGSLLTENQQQISRLYGEEDFSLSEMIERSGYCPDHFRRCFRSAVRQTPAQYMIHLRMEHAKRILRGSSASQSVREAALLSGYRDPYYFSKLFKRYTGLNPTEYIKLGE